MPCRAGHRWNHAEAVFQAIYPQAEYVGNGYDYLLKGVPWEVKSCRRQRLVALSSTAPPRHGGRVSIREYPKQGTVVVYVELHRALLHRRGRYAVVVFDEDEIHVWRYFECSATVMDRCIRRFGSYSQTGGGRRGGHRGRMWHGSWKTIYEEAGSPSFTPEVGTWRTVYPDLGKRR